MRSRTRNKNRRKIKINKKLLKQVLIYGGALCLVALITGGVLYYQYLNNPSRVFRVDAAGEDNLEWDEHFDRDVVNIVLLGFDRTEDRDEFYEVYRPDTIMIASINFRTNAVSLVSIPRDSCVIIHGRSFHARINAAYYYGFRGAGGGDPHQSGIDTQLRTIQDFMGGVPLHYYISLDMDGVVEIIDRLGGIHYDVDIDVWSRQGNLLIEKGYQLLDGKDFLRYVRNRLHDSDFSRISRQQRILVAALEQLKQKGKLSDIPAIYRSLNENVETNLSLTQIASLALYAKKVDTESINTYVFPGSNRWDLDRLYVVIDESSRVRLIKEIFGVEVPPLPPITLRGPREPDDETEPSPSGPPNQDPGFDEPIPSDHEEG